MLAAVHISHKSICFSQIAFLVLTKSALLLRDFFRVTSNGRIAYLALGYLKERMPGINSNTKTR